MYTFVTGLLGNLSTKARIIVGAIVLVLVLVLAFFLFGQIKSCGYDKGRAEYEAASESWKTERAKLLGGIAERDKQIEQLKAKEAAYIAADQAGKKIDDALAQKIDDATKAAAAEATATDQPADCWVRGDRTCAKLAGLQPPIKIDCDAYKRKICGQ